MTPNGYAKDLDKSTVVYERSVIYYIIIYIIIYIYRN